MNYGFIETFRALLHVPQYYMVVLFVAGIFFVVFSILLKYLKVELNRRHYLIFFIVSCIQGFLLTTFLLFLLSNDFIKIVSWFSLTKLASLGALLAGIGSIANVLLSGSSLKIAKKASDQAAYSNILAAERSVFPKIELDEAVYNNKKNELYMKFNYFEDILDLLISFSEDNEKIILQKDVEVKVTHRDNIPDITMALYKELIKIPHLVYKEIKSPTLDRNPSYIEFFIPIELKDKYLISLEFMSRFHSDFKDGYILSSKDKNIFEIKLLFRKLPWNEIGWFDDTLYKEIDVIGGIIKTKKIETKK